MNKFQEQVNKFMNGFSDEFTKCECKEAIASLKNQNFSDEFIYTALKDRSHKAWHENGFGLLFVKKFQDRINSKLSVQVQETTSNSEENWAKEEHVFGQTNGEALSILRSTIASIQDPHVEKIPFPNDPFVIYHNKKDQTRYTMTRNGLYDNHLNMLIDGLKLFAGGYGDIDWFENL